ncbi:MAG: hypothetical protein ABL983_12710, partial [Nitrospira sp.]
SVSYSIKAEVANPTVVVPSGFGVVSGVVTFLDTYHVTATAGTLLYLDDLGFSGVQAFITSPTGQAVASQGFLNGGFTPVFLPESGTYTLQISPLFPGSFGSPYQFHIRNLTSEAVPLSIGNIVSHQFDSGGEEAVYRLTVSAGQRLYFDQLVEQGSSPQRTLFSSDGTSISFSDLHRFVLPGTYYLLLDNGFGQPSTYDFRLLDLATAPTLSLDRTVSAASTGLAAQLYQFDVTGTQTARVTALSTSGVTDARWGISDGSTSSRLNQLVTASFDEDLQTGTQWLIVDGDQGTPFSYSFSASLIPTPPPAIPQIINVRPSHGQDNQATGQGTLFTYDPVFSQLTSITDEQGHVTLFDVDPANGNIRSITGVVGALGGGDDIVRQITYTPQGLMDLITDPLGYVTDFNYDIRGRLTEIILAKGTPSVGIRRLEYDEAGNVSAVIDENNHRTEYVYDAMNRLTIVRDALLHETRYTYDESGNVTSVQDAGGSLSHYEYDRLNHLSAATDPNGGLLHYGYDQAGNLISVVNLLGQETLYGYDPRGQLTKMTDAAGGITMLDYDGNGNLATLTDASSFTTRYQYDARGRVIAETDPLGQVTRFQYDSLNPRIGLIDRDNHYTASRD